ncbi:MAG: hypothetical protein ACM3JB_28390 [Acidobacteriaceae bacterium]
MSIRGFAVVFSLFAISLVVLAQSPSLPDASPESNRATMMSNTNLNCSTISGSLIGLDGRPIPDGEIQLQSLVTGTALATANSSINGSFQFVNVPTGEYEIVAYRGIEQTRQRVKCDLTGLNMVVLRLSTSQAQAGSGDTVSVTALRVPGKARDLLAKAQQAFQKNKLEEAWKQVQKALDVLPTYSEALTLRGILRISKGDHTGGAEDLQASIKNDGNYSLAYFALGALQNVQGQFDQARQTLEQGLRVQPTSWQGYFELSKSMLGKSDYRSALKDIVKAESLGSKYPPVYLVKAHALLGLKFYGEAATAFEHYLQLEPGGPNAADARKSLQAAQAFAETASN